MKKRKSSKLTEKQEKILTVLGIAVVVAVLITVLVVVGTAIAGRSTSDKSASENLPTTDVEIIRYYDWYKTDGKVKWKFSDGIRVSLFARESRQEEFLLYGDIFYTVQEEFKLIMIADNKELKDSSMYYYVITGPYLKFYRFTGSMEGPTEEDLAMVFVKGSEWEAIYKEHGDSAPS